MDSLVLASPHLDDGVLSCGQFMAGRPDTLLVTVFAGMPDDHTLSSDFDRNSGFGSAQQAVTARRDEDARAAHLLNATPYHLPFVDGQYRPDVPLADSGQIAVALAYALAAAGERTLVAPLGIAHPDHAAVGDAAITLALNGVDVVFYEELPGRVLWPELAAKRLRVLELVGLDVERLTFIGEGPMSRKARAIDCYESQRWALNRRCLFVPERFHRVTLCG